MLVIFSIWCQQSCGLSFGVVPFVSKRSTGLVYGLVGAGGNAGAAVTQASELNLFCLAGTPRSVLVFVCWLALLLLTANNSLCLPCPAFSVLSVCFSSLSSLPNLNSLLHLHRAEPHPGLLLDGCDGHRHDCPLRHRLLPHVVSLLASSTLFLES